jgi:tRNA pseudouridine55 synthase
MEPGWKQEFLEGKVLLIDKPLRWTSFDAVKKVRIQTGVSKVGHAGTLDPLATGLLIICTGKFTKRINEFMAREKEYTGTFTLGSTTPTYDLESTPEPSGDWTAISPERMQEATLAFTGTIAQLPPAHSAVKVDGKKLYELARAGKEVKREPRQVTISIFEIDTRELPLVHFRVVCSTGTYIRSLADDYGRALGCGAHLSSLRRTRIGEFSVDDALSLVSFEEQVKALKAAAQNG